MAFPEPPATVDPRREGGDVVVGHAERVRDPEAAVALHLRPGVHRRGGLLLRGKEERKVCSRKPVGARALHWITFGESILSLAR